MLQTEILALYHELWVELHLRTEGDDAWVRSWINKLPKDLEKNHALDILRICPVREAEFQRWAVEFHDCMTFALGRRPFRSLPRYALGEIAKLPWSKSKGGRVSGTGCGACAARRAR